MSFVGRWPVSPILRDGCLALPTQVSVCASKAGEVVRADLLAR